MTAALPPPGIEQPAPYEVSYGLVTGIAPAGTQRVVVRAGRRVLADRRLRGRHFSLRVDLPPREGTVAVTAVAAGGRQATATVAHVLGLPRAAAPVAQRPRRDPVLEQRVRRLVRSFPGTSAVYVQDLVTGAGAAWNARARLPAASTLKVAIAAAVLSRVAGTPVRGSPVDRLLRRMLIPSDNDAANTLEIWLAGSTSAGGRLVTSMMERLGLDDTLMYGGYERELSAAGIPLRVDEQPSWGIGKRTSARDLAGLLRAVWLASGGAGRLRSVVPGFTPADARYLLYLLAHVADPGKLDRRVGAVSGVRVLHKAGWIDAARHDAGLVFWPGGVFVASVLTYRAAGAGVASDVLAGRVAGVALARFARGGGTASRTGPGASAGAGAGSRHPSLVAQSHKAAGSRLRAAPRAAE